MTAGGGVGVDSHCTLICWLIIERHCFVYNVVMLILLTNKSFHLLNHNGLLGGFRAVQNLKKNN